MSTKKTAVAALCLMLLPTAPAFPQAEVNPDHFPDATDAQVVQLRSDLLEPQAYSSELQAQEDQVEEARQAAISAGIQGDGAGTYVDAYRDQLAELNQLKAKLNPATKSVESASAIFVRR